jgi:ribokinase
VPVLLDAGGVDAPLSPALLATLTVISPNETELARLTGGQPTETEQQVLAAAASLQQAAADAAAAAEAAAAPPAQQQQQQRRLQVLVKRGSAGSLLVGPGGQPVVQQAAIPAAKVVDTTGAGDCFTAAWMVAVLQGLDAPMQFASAAASICVSRPGAMTSLPSRADVEQLLERLPNS